MKEQKVKFELSVDQINTILTALAEQPYKQSAPIIAELHRQFNEAQKATELKVEKNEE